MLKCRDMSHHAGDYIEKHMSQREKISYGFHLFLCGHCRLFLRHFRTSIAVSRELARTEALSENELNSILERTFREGRSDVKTD